MIGQACFRSVQGMQCNLTASWHSYSHFLGRLRRGTQIHNGILQTCIFIVHTSFCCGSCLQPGSPGKSINTSGPCFVCCGLTVILNSPGQGEVPPVPPLDYMFEEFICCRSLMEQLCFILLARKKYSSYFKTA